MMGSMPLLRLPIFWGGLACLGFYGVIQQEPFRGGMAERYFASHPVEYVSTALFFVGLAALGIKAFLLALQWVGHQRVTLGPLPAEGQSADTVAGLLAGLDEFPARLQGGYLVGRLRDALDYVRRKRSAENLDEHIRYLAELDMERMQSSYALVRIVVWAIPILGFLGTVIGITLAIAQLSPEALENSLPEVTSGLGVAFDTTALALSLSILLMFAKFFLERTEGRMLLSVDARVSAELVGRFQEYGSGTDPNMAAVRRMAETVIRSSETLVGRQAELWSAAMQAAQVQWGQLSLQVGQQLEVALTNALGNGLKQHASTLTAAEASLAEENRRHWNQVQQALATSATAVIEQQAELVKQGQVLRQVVEATGQVKALEVSLNENLSALAGARNFEETVMSLAAAIQLLSARLGNSASDELRVRLPANRPADHAA